MADAGSDTSKSNKRSRSELEEDDRGVGKTSAMEEDGKFTHG